MLLAEYQLTYKALWVPAEKLSPYSQLIENYCLDAFRKETIKSEEMDPELNGNNDNDVQSKPETTDKQQQQQQQKQQQPELVDNEELDDSEQVDSEEASEVLGSNGSTHEKGRYSCDFCSNTYSTDTSLRRHLSSVHDARLYMCRIHKCMRKFLSTDALEAHKRNDHAQVCFPHLHTQS